MRTFRSELGLSLILVVLFAAACGSSGSTTEGTTGTSGAGAGPGTTGTPGGTTGAAAGTTGTASATGAAATGTAAGSSTGVAINGTTGGTTGGTSSGGAGTTGTTGGIAHGPGNGGYCDALAVEQNNVTDFLLLYIGESDGVYKKTCDPTKYGPDAGSFPQLGGIWMYYTSNSAQGVNPGGCDDLGLGEAPPDAGAVTPPDGAMTVAAAMAYENGLYDAGASFQAESVYGVVTWSDSFSGEFYIEDFPGDGGPLPNSGVEIYVSASYLDGGALPSPAPTRGDVMYATNMKFAFYGNNAEFEYTKTSAISVLGQSALPPAIPVTAADLESQSTSISGYTGMRVVNKNKYTLTDTCPTIQ